jgi:hypothetical protein
VFEVANTLGAGFIEKVNERALLKELKLQGVRALPQASFTVLYKGRNVGDYFADILVEDSVVVELKWVDRLTNKRSLSSDQFSKPQGGVEAYRTSAGRFEQGPRVRVEVTQFVLLRSKLGVILQMLGRLEIQPAGMPHRGIERHLRG